MSETTDRSQNQREATCSALRWLAPHHVQQALRSATCAHVLDLSHKFRVPFSAALSQNILMRVS